ncbi:MAG: hypothetical protein IPK59_13620 [Rhodospirillaceae bacterium]|nr:hypothetical protein [Rhodospirillaceae bacterium]
MTAEQPGLRDILRAINRVIAGDKPPPSVNATPAASPETPQKIPGITPIVAKLTTPLGKPQRNNFLVMALLALDVVLGATFGLVGYFGLQSDSIALTGAAMSTIGLLLMLLYQLFGRER